MLVVDLEATCWKDNVVGTERRQTINDMEVIEFGCIVCTFNGEVIDSKSFFVKPQLHPTLTTFCTELTSIQQSDVDNAPTYSGVIKNLDQWLEQYELTIWASWGNYDKNQLIKEHDRYGVSPNFLKLSHENLKKRWSKGKKKFRNAGPKVALEFHGLEFQGNYHRAIDDAFNIARLLPFIKLDEFLEA